MKKLTMLLMVLLASVCFSAANSIQTFTMFDGEGSMTPTTHQFVFAGFQQGIWMDKPFGDYPDVPGLQQCLQCDPRNTFSIVLYDSGTGYDHDGNLFAGLMQFDGFPFVSSLAPNGMLTVIYDATLRLSVTFCSSVDDCHGSHLVWNPGVYWLVTAQFAPDPSLPDTWHFVDARFATAPTPEPSSMLLMGSGIAMVIAKVRSSRSKRL
jgi:hypothetical protein